MNTTNNTVRPTKKQRQLLTFIESFINEHGYSPSYREIMNGLNYTSVATVSLHINNLIKRGHIRKTDHSARSLEIINFDEKPTVTSNLIDENQEKWLVNRIEHAFREAENSGNELENITINNLITLVNTLKILEIEGAAQSFLPRLRLLKNNLKDHPE